MVQGQMAYIGGVSYERGTPTCQFMESRLWVGLREAPGMMKGPLGTIAGSESS